jgi:hypothetical protein
MSNPKSCICIEKTKGYFSNIMYIYIEETESYSSNIIFSIPQIQAKKEIIIEMLIADDCALTVLYTHVT